MLAATDNTTRRLSWFIRLAVGLCIFWLAFRDVDTRSLADAFARARLGWLAAAMLSVPVTVALVVARWHALLGVRRGAHSMVLAAAVVASQVANIALPFRLGDAVRIGAVSRVLRQPPAEVLAAVAVERFFDATLVALAAGALAVAGSLPPFARAGMLSLSLSVAAALACAVVALRLRSRIERLSTGAGAFIARQVSLLMGGFTRIATSHTIVRVFGWSLAVIGASILTTWLVFRAFDLAVPAAAAAVVVIATQVGSIVVPVPGSIGIAQVITVAVLQLWNVTEGTALAVALTVYVVSRAPRLAALPLLMPFLTRAGHEAA